MYSAARYSILLGSVLLAVNGMNAGKSFAQAPDVCQPPNADEYLVLVMSPTEAATAQLRETSPAGATTTVCTYLQDVVLRVGGFTSAETAIAWLQAAEAQGLQAFVARPPETSTESLAPVAPATPSAVTPSVVTPAAPAPADPSATAEPAAAAPFPQPDPVPDLAAAPPATAPAVPEQSPAPPENPAAASSASQPAPQTIAYNPQPLGAGYAVLVDYANRPEVAAAVQQLLDRNVGLVSYGQRPYLLAAFTDDPTVADATLRTLSDQNFNAMIIDSRRAVRLTETVR